MGTYLIEFDDLFEDVRRNVFADVRDKMIKRYTNEIEVKFENLLGLLDTGLIVPDDRNTKRN